jgi:thymidylate kinase/predicted nucleotidyltransferase
MKGKLLCFIGVDGTGKTTIAKKFVELMTKRKVPAKYLWFRFPYFFTLSILLTARVLGLTKYSNKSGYRIVEHNFGSQPLKSLYPIVLFLDALLYYYYKIYLLTRVGFIVICDRWVPDIIIDSSIDTSNPELKHNWIGKLYGLLSSKANFQIIADASDNILETRRPETKFDPTTKVRRSLYRSYAKKHSENVIYSDDSAEVTFEHLMFIINNSELDLRQKKKTYGSSNVWLQPFLEKRVFSIASNWFFQGTLIMTRSERAFRYLLELTIFLALFTSMSFFLPLFWSTIVALIIAHTINWILNGNFWVVYKFFGRESRLEVVMIFLAKLRSRKDFSQKGVLTVSAFGSLSRGEFKSSSDLDIRIVRLHGIRNWGKANLFILQLRTVAFFRKIPLDLFLLDSPNQIYKHISRGEKPVVLYDADGILNAKAEKRMKLERLANTDKVLDNKSNVHF